MLCLLTFPPRPASALERVSRQADDQGAFDLRRRLLQVCSYGLEKNTAHAFPSTNSQGPRGLTGWSSVSSRFVQRSSAASPAKPVFLILGSRVVACCANNSSLRLTIHLRKRSCRRPCKPTTFHFRSPTSGVTPYGLPIDTREWKSMETGPTLCPPILVKPACLTLYGSSVVMAPFCSGLECPSPARSQTKLRRPSSSLVLSRLLLLLRETLCDRGRATPLGTTENGH